MKGFDVEGCDIWSTKPVLNPDGRPLIIGQMKEGLEYRILEINNPLFLTKEEPPKVGESVCLQHSFHPYSASGHAYEFLTLFIGRKDNKGNIDNFVRYFNTVQQLEACLVGVKLELDQQWARDRIAELEKKIARFKKNYNL